MSLKGFNLRFWRRALKQLRSEPFAFWQYCLRCRMVGAYITDTYFHEGKVIMEFHCDNCGSTSKWDFTVGDPRPIFLDDRIYDRAHDPR